jgi:nicotinamidase-related amidase
VRKSCADKPSEIALNMRFQAWRAGASGAGEWELVTVAKRVPAAETAIIICDMWDKHWCRGANERVATMAPRMNEVVKAARAAGITIIHAPSETMEFYRDSPARARALAAPHVPMPEPVMREVPPVPIDDSDGGSDTGETSWYTAWTRQHAAIEIDEERDAISDSGQEVWNLMHERGLRHLLIMGVHTNMCILGRSFAIKAMVQRGVDIVLVRDLTDAMYNPAKPPHVSHDEGTRLVVDYIEKHWCPTVLSDDLLPAPRAARGRPPGARSHPERSRGASRSA